MHFYVFVKNSFLTFDTINFMLLEVTATNHGLYGTICIIVGIGLFLLVGRRRFYRRNSAGLEEYKNYSSAVANGCLNKLMKLIAIILIFAGIMFRFMACSQSYKERQNYMQSQEKRKTKQ